MRLSAMALAMGLAGIASAQLQISLGVRETHAGGGPSGAIGSNGGSLGGIEWINLDGQSLVLDGTWQQFTFTLASDPVTPFAGATANGVLQGDYGVLEHVRIRNQGGYTQELNLWIDDVANTITPPGGAPTTTVFGDFEAYSPGSEVIFQEPRFSGSTTAFLQNLPNASVVVDNMAHAGAKSDLIRFAYISNATTNWLRLTTSNTPNIPNPLIRFDQSSQVSFWMRGVVVPEPATLAALGGGLALLLRRRKR